MNILKSAIVVVLLAVCFVLPERVGRTENGYCQQQCSIKYTIDFNKCEHIPACVKNVSQAYDVCVAKCK